MRIIIGLGNPGKDYEKTRHNAGFRVIDLLCEKYEIQTARMKFHSMIGEGKIAGEKVLLVKPTTYMNNSGQAVREIVSYYQLEPKDIVVFSDDIDIPFGTLRIKRKGSAGGHNGLKSVIYHLQSDEFPRIKLGVGKKQEGEDLADFVLGRFSRNEQEVMDTLIEMAAESLEVLIKDGEDKAMSEYNGRSAK